MKSSERHVANSASRHLIKTLLLALALLCVPPLAAEEPATDPTSDMARQQLLFCFQGKGSFLSYDGGVAAEAYGRIAALREGNVILAGNSSGAILAAYFACQGFSDDSLKVAEQQLLQSDDSAIRKMEAPGDKALKLMRKEATELSHDVLNHYIAFALGVSEDRAQTLKEIVRQSRAQIRHPLLLVACNREVLQNCPPDDMLKALNYREFDPNTFSVSWKPEVYQYYQKHPDRFARDNPDLQLGPTPYIGKAVTFFVDRSLYELLRQIPEDERMADLRLMENPADIAQGILASVSEPTYFRPIAEPHPEKLLCGDTPGKLGNVKRRSYCGGYLVSMPAQDVRRMLPALRVMGTGWTQPPVAARRYLKTMYLVDMESVAHLNCFWCDMELSPSEEIHQAMIAKNLSSSDEFEAGRATARRAFGGAAPLPSFIAMPALCYAAEKALSVEASDDIFGSPDEQGRRPLKTLRGLGPLLAAEPGR